MSNPHPPGVSMPNQTTAVPLPEPAKDRELLRMAAKANGARWKWVTCPKWSDQVPGLYHRDYVNKVDYWFAWNPLDDDEDAFKLAVKLRIGLTFIPRNESGDPPIVNACNCEGALCEAFEEGADAAATRRAIVRAAAALAQKGA